LKKLSKKIEKALTNTQSKLKKLAQEKFACAADARKELTKISKEFKYHQVENIEIIEKNPDIKEENQSKYYQISASKAINNPTMRWIFQYFQSVYLVNFQQKREFYNLTSEMKYILLFLPEACRNYYRYIS
jgi:transposase